MFTDPTGMSKDGIDTKYVDENGKTLLNTNDGSNAVITVTDDKKKSFLSAVRGTSNKSKLDSKEWNFTMKKNLVGDWSQWHENTQSWFSTEDSRMNAARFWQTGDYNYYDKAVSSHTGKLRSDIVGWFLSIASSLHGINVANSIRGSASNEVSSTVGAARSGFSKLPKGFKQTKQFGYQHGQKVYEYKGKFYSPDVDSHNGGAWKVFENNGGKLKRIGTADEFLNIFKQ